MTVNLYNHGDSVHIFAGGGFDEAHGIVEHDMGGAVVHIHITGERGQYPHDAKPIARESVSRLMDGCEECQQISAQQKADEEFEEEAEEETAPEPRRVESSSQDLTAENAYGGQNWATHSVAVWIENDGSFADTALNYARMDNTGGQLGDYIGRLLFDRDALAYEERRRLTRDDVHNLGLVADDLTQDGDDTPAREALKRVNWEYVAAALVG